MEKIVPFENSHEYVETFHELDRKKRPDLNYFEFLGKKKFLKDFDIEGKRIMIRGNLKLGETVEAISKKEGFISNSAILKFHMLLIKQKIFK